MKNRTRNVLLAAITTVTAATATTVLIGAGGCAEQEKRYGVERQVFYQPIASRREIWAVAPAVNLSGYKDVDGLLQADLVFAQLQQVRGLTIVPVNRVIEVCAALKIEKIGSQAQADQVCDVLGCDALLVPTVTAYDAYAPPKMGASLQLITKTRVVGPSRTTTVTPPPRPSIVQAVGLFDAANGSVRDAINVYAAGRNDPMGPMGTKEYLVSMDRYCGFVYHELIVEILSGASRRRV